MKVPIKFKTKMMPVTSSRMNLILKQGLQATWLLSIANWNHAWYFNWSSRIKSILQLSDFSISAKDVSFRPSDKSAAKSMLRWPLLTSFSWPFNNCRVIALPQNSKTTSVFLPIWGSTQNSYRLNASNLRRHLWTIPIYSLKRTTPTMKLLTIATHLGPCTQLT